MPEIIPNLHPLLVHFPIALISVSAFFHVAALLTRSKPACAVHCNILAHTTLWLGALAVLPTAFFGWQASNSVNHDEVSHAAMMIHRTWAVGTLAVLAILAGWDGWRNKVDSSPAWWFVVAIIGAWGLVATTAWHGGELVYRHGLGVIALPETEEVGTGHEHGHDHGAMSEMEGKANPEATPDVPSHEHSQQDHTH